jgi:putative ABC transport system permease protein
MFRWISGLRVVLRSAIFRKRVEADLDEEIKYHLEQEINEGLKAGLSAKEARYAALQSMGAITKSRDECRDMRGTRWAENLFLDFRYSLHSIRRSKGLAIGVVVSMALGLGVTASFLSQADFFIFRPLPVPETNRVVRIANSTSERLDESFSYAEYQDYVEHGQSFAGIASYQTPLIAFAANPKDQPRAAVGMPVSGNFFSMLEVNPILGRGFFPEEDAVPGRNAVAVISYKVWQRDFAGNTDIIGREIRINGHSLKIVGVTPESFTGVEQYVQPDVYFPRMMTYPILEPSANVLTDRSMRFARLYARLKPGRTVQQGNEDVARIASQLEMEHPETNKGRRAIVLTQFGYRTTADPRLLRMAVRTAMGAPRRRLLRQLVMESAIFSTAGSLVGLAIATWLAGFVFPRGSELATDFQIQVDRRVAVFTFVVGLVAAFLAGMIPALRCSRADLNSLLKASDPRNQAQKTWGRQILVGIQVAVASLFLVVSGLFVKDLQIAANQSPGFRLDHLLTMSFNPYIAGYDLKKTQAFYANFLERLRATPGIRNAAIAQERPFGIMNNGFTSLKIEGYELAPNQPSIVIRSAFVSPGYFETLGIPMIRGRAFDRRDDANAPRTVIINQTMAERYWPNRDPIGVHVEIKGDDGGPAEIIGVARNAKYGGMNERPMSFLYRSYNQGSETYAALFVETERSPEAMTSVVRNELQNLAPDMPVFDVRTMENHFRENGMLESRAATRMFTPLGIVALILGILGLYGVISYSVGQRTHEIGIRMALGASKRQVLRMILLQGMRPTLIALAVALGLAVLLKPTTTGMLAYVNPHDPVVYTGVLALILFTTGIACVIPARRASIVDPNITLRNS